MTVVRHLCTDNSLYTNFIPLVYKWLVITSGVSSLILISINGPTLAVWNHINYTKVWLRHNNSAFDKQG